LLIDPKANKVRGVAKLTKKDARSSTGLFLLEGPQGLKEALNRPKLIVELFATEDAVERYPQGVVAVCEQLHSDLEDIIAAKPRLVALLANIRDPGNAGTVLRAADAAGADAVIFSSNSVDVYNPKVVRSTTGSVFHVPFAIDVPIEDAIAALKSAGLQVFAANGGGVEIPSLGDEVLAKPTAWVFGNEAWGFEQGTLDLVDQEVAVPLYGAAESLNLATAASICLYVTAFAQNKA
jgi:TrmH family RNA methyltransferase